MTTTNWFRPHRPGGRLPGGLNWFRPHRPGGRLPGGLNWFRPHRPGGRLSTGSSSRPRAGDAILALLLAALPAGAAGLEKHKDWAKSPEYTLLASDAEKKDWKKVKSDEDGDKFLALFWARRDPDLKTPTNEFKVRFDALASKADELFSAGGKKGSLTERGKCLILFGAPTKSTAARIGAPSERAGTTTSDTFAEAASYTTRYTFQYDKMPEWSDVRTLEVKIDVDSATKSEVLLDKATVKRLQERAVQVALANPDLKEQPKYKTREEVEAEAKAARDAAIELAKGETLAPAVRELLEKALAGEATGPLTLQPMAYRDGATRLMVQLFATAAQVPAPDSVRLVLLAKGKDGHDAARRDESANLQKSRGDFFTDRLLPVNPGEYDVAAALLDAAGTPLVTGRRSTKIEALSADFSASPLFIAYNDFPAENPKPEDAFTFSARKFVSRGDGKLDGKADGLSYVVRVYNPGVDPATKMMTLKRSLKIKPATGSAVDVPLPPDEPQPAPEAKDGVTGIAVDLAGNIVENGLSQYFRPGSYELRIKITDVVSQKSVDVSAPFTIVAPPGSEKPADKPAPAPKKKS